MKIRGASTAAVAMTAAVLLSACSGGETVTRTDGTASGSTAASATSAASEAPAEYAPAPEAPPATGATPGATLSYNGKALCSLGPAVKGVGGRTGFLIAGHCAVTEDGEPLTGAFSAGGVSLTRPEQPSSRARGDDSAVIWTTEAADDVRLGGFPVAGALSAADALALPGGTPICLSGQTSGTRCGKKSAIASPDTVDFSGVRNAAGDSGGPVFVVKNGKAYIIGIMSTGDGSSYAHASVFGTAAARLQVSPVVAP